MSIVLRTNKGSALTYDEMDRNFSQFFYSGSVSPDGTSLRLHFTGSDALDLVGVGEDYGPRYVSIPFPTSDIEISAAGVAGDNTQIQYNNNGAFGASSNLVFKDSKLGIGKSDPLVRLDINAGTNNAAIIALRGVSANTKAEVDFYDGATLIGKIGRTDTSALSNIYITNNRTVGAGYGKVHISIGAASSADNDIVIGTFKTGNLFGVGTTDPNRQGSFVGAQGIGISPSSVNTNQSYLSPIPDGIYNANTGGLKKLIPNGSEQNGLLISSPNSLNGGNIVVALNTDSEQKEGFNIIKSNAGNYNSSEVIASFQASGKVGINTNFPSDIGLTVDGIISGSGNAQIDGTLTVKTVTTGTADTTSALVATSAGVVQKIAAAPVPLGGIIMWSGAISAIPAGWRLCNGANGTPNLTDKFIIGAGNTYNVESSGGSATYTPSGTIAINKLTTTMIPRHTHMHLDDDHTYVANVSGYGPSGTPTTAQLDKYGGGTATFNSAVSITGYDSTSNNSGNRQAFHTGVNTTAVRGTTIMSDNPANPTGTFTGTLGNNLPPYYALAFIMYVGV